MQVRRIDGAASVGAKAASTLVAIGNFDGVHRGHRTVLEAAVAEADRSELRPIVLTFHPHPASVLGRGALPVLTGIDRKVELICRIDPRLTVVVEEFTAELAKKTPQEFVCRLLLEQLGASVVLVGQNFRFGRGRAGDFALLKAMSTAHGFEAHVQPLAGDAGGPYSSSRVRDALSAGRLDLVEDLLGRPHSISGRVVHGDGRGSKIGVPTANFEDISEALPPHGVYAVLLDRVDEQSSRQLGCGVANIGSRPTHSAGFSVEAHVFDFNGDLYDQRLRVHFVERLRDEQRFSDVATLVDQIGRDSERARAITAGRRPSQEAEGAWY